jgi:hypothetical protein
LAIHRGRFACAGIRTIVGIAVRDAIIHRDTLGFDGRESPVREIRMIVLDLRPNLDVGVDGFHSDVEIVILVAIGGAARSRVPHVARFPAHKLFVADLPKGRGHGGRSLVHVGDPRARETDGRRVGHGGAARNAGEVHARLQTRPAGRGEGNTLLETRHVGVLAGDVAPVHHVGVSAARVAHLVGTHGRHSRSVSGIIGIRRLCRAVIDGVVLAEEFIIDGGYGGRCVDGNRHGMDRRQ